MVANSEHPERVTAAMVSIGLRFCGAGYKTRRDVWNGVKARYGRRSGEQCRPAPHSSNRLLQNTHASRNRASASVWPLVQAPIAPPGPLTASQGITMIDDVVLGQATVPDGVELRLVQYGADFAILLEDNELMSTNANASEEALAVMTCEKLAGLEAPQLLIGGYGMGFTLRAALAMLGDDAGIVVAEIVPEILAWARGPMQEFTGGCLDDPRVHVVDEDVALLIASAQDAYDAILLDVDNGPEGLTRRNNDGLYSAAGLQRAMGALRPGGILAIWSASPEPAFTQRLRDGGYQVTETTVRAEAENKGLHHLIWFARKP